MGKVILSCAVTGAIHTPSMSPHLPVTPDEIARAAIDAAHAGAAIVHLHARDPQNGRPRQDPTLFAQFIPAIAAATDAVINISTGGAPTMLVAERVQPALQLKPELASLNMGSINFGLYEMLKRQKTFAHDWEEPYLAGTVDLVFRNSFKDIAFILDSCGANGTRFEFECYDIAHLYNTAHILDQGKIAPPLFIQSIFGIRGGIGTDVEDVLHMRRTADRLFGNDYRWSVLGAGRHQMRIATLSAAMGGHVRVGMEDSLWDGPGRMATSSADQVRRIRTIIEALGHEVATPAEARQMLALRGAAAPAV